MESQFVNPIDRRLSEGLNQINSINNIISKLIDRMNSVEFYFKNKPL